MTGGKPDSVALRTNAVYRIELCSGETRQWRYLGPGEASQVWWRDMETRQEFTESSLLYAWKIVGKENE